MITIDNHYSLKITIAGKEFADQWKASIQDLSIIEEAGLNLPVFELNFDTDDNELIRLLHENTVVSISWSSLGWTTNYTLEADFIIINPKVATRGDHGWKVNLVGIHKFHPEYIKPQQYILDSPVTSGQQIEKLVSGYGKVDKNFDLSSMGDKMNWSSMGRTTGRNILDIWQHSDPKDVDSLLMIAPTVKGFRIYDLNKMLADAPTHQVSNHNGRQLETICYDPDYEVTTNSGLNNMLGAKGIDQPVYDLDSGELTKVKVDPYSKIKLVPTTQLQVNEKSKPNYQPMTYQSRNVHKFWKIRESTNRLHHLLLSTVKCVFHFDDCMRDIHPLDTCLFLEEEKPVSHNSSTEQNSGLYIVTKVSRRLVGNRIATRVEMCRESQKLMPKEEKDDKKSKDKEK